MLRSIVLVGLSTLCATAAFGQATDCINVAKDVMVKKEFVQRNDYTKLLFLARLTQMDETTAKQHLDHTGKVEVGPIKIGPGTWNKDKQEKLRKELDQFVSVDQLLNSASTIVVSSGDEVVAKVVSDCIAANGGLRLAILPAGEKRATIEMMWTPFPGGGASAVVDEISVYNGKIVGGVGYTKKGSKLGDRTNRTITIERLGDNKDLLVVANLNTGSRRGYLPPEKLPDPPPLGKLYRTIEAPKAALITSGGGGPGPYCQLRHSEESCVTPQHKDGKFEVGKSKPRIVTSNGTAQHVGYKVTNDDERKYCVQFWASTTACPVQVSISGVATALEVYPED